MSRAYLWLPVSSFIVLLASRAHATPDFPGVITSKLGLPKEPPCLLCHATVEGQKGNVVQPFGKKAQAYGLKPYDPQTLASILDKMTDAQDDSDHDGMSDIDELKAGRDPNINDITGEPPEDYAPPVYGCHAGQRSRVPRGAAWAAVAACAGAMSMLGLRSRARRRRAVHARRKDV
jgi:hypothetical protein